MKLSRFLAIFSLSACLGVVFCQDANILNAKIRRVMVYSDRAIVERVSSVDVDQGLNQVLFDDLPEGLDPNSLQVSGQGGITLEDVVLRSSFYSAIPDQRIKDLTAQCQTLRDQLDANNDQIERDAQERLFLEKIVDRITNKGEKSESVSAELKGETWTAIMQFYHDRLAALDADTRRCQRESKATAAELERLERDLNLLSAGRKKEKRQALVILQSATRQKASLSLSYTVMGPSWRPIYDLRVNYEGQSIEVGYSALISQNTGEDWAGVNLVLSTARPEIRGTQPELEPWILEVSRNAPKPSSMGGLKKEANMFAVQMFQKEEQEMDKLRESDGLVARPVEASKGALAVSFAVSGSSTIQSDGLQHRVAIMTKAFPAAFRHSCAPKLSSYAYLKAKFKNDSDFPFLPGKSKIYLDGNYVAESVMDLVSPGEELWTFLGADESVKIEYKQVKRFKDEQGIFDKKQRFVRSFETKIINTKKKAVELVLWDQLPVSPDQKVVVKLLSPKYDKDSDSLKKNNQDMLEWLITLGGGESRIVEFSYSVEFPQDYWVEGF